MLLPAVTTAGVAVGSWSIIGVLYFICATFEVSFTEGLYFVDLSQRELCLFKGIGSIVIPDSDWGLLREMSHSMDNPEIEESDMSERPITKDWSHGKFEEPQSGVARNW